MPAGTHDVVTTRRRPRQRPVAVAVPPAPVTTALEKERYQSRWRVLVTAAFIDARVAQKVRCCSSRGRSLPVPS